MNQFYVITYAEWMYMYGDELGKVVPYIFAYKSHFWGRMGATYMRRYTVADSLAHLSKIYHTEYRASRSDNEVAHQASSWQNLLTQMDIQLALGSRAILNMMPWVNVRDVYAGTILIPYHKKLLIIGVCPGDAAPAAPVLRQFNGGRPNLLFPMT